MIPPTCPKSGTMKPNQVWVEHLIFEVPRTLNWNFSRKRYCCHYLQTFSLKNHRDSQAKRAPMQRLKLYSPIFLHLPRLPATSLEAQWPVLRPSTPMWKSRGGRERQTLNSQALPASKAPGTSETRRRQEHLPPRDTTPAGGKC